MTGLIIVFIVVLLVAMFVLFMNYITSDHDDQQLINRNLYDFFFLPKWKYDYLVKAFTAISLEWGRVPYDYDGWYDHKPSSKTNLPELKKLIEASVLASKTNYNTRFGYFRRAYAVSGTRKSPHLVRLHPDDTRANYYDVTDKLLTSSPLGIEIKQNNHVLGDKISGIIEEYSILSNVEDELSKTIQEASKPKPILLEEKIQVKALSTKGK
jgi:hypothetical protein